MDDDVVFPSVLVNVTDTLGIDATLASSTSSSVNHLVNATAGTEELFHGYSPALLTFASAACICFMLVGVPGNLITIIALARCKKVRNATAVFIINLSLSDLLFCCFNLPLATSTFWYNAWIHGNLLCRFFPLMRYGLLAVSLFTVLAITINRYVMIGHPRIYPRVYRHRYLGIMVTATWLCAFLTLIPTWRGIWGKFGLDHSIGSCSILPDENDRSPKEFLFMMAFMVPCLCIIICYARIFYIVRKTAMRTHEPATVNNSVRMMSGKNVRTQKAMDDANHSDRQLIEKSSKTSKEENSENSSSLSNYGGYPHSATQLAAGSNPNIQRSRPYLSKFREEELKFIDTSVDSELPPSLSALRRDRQREGTPSSNVSSTHAAIVSSSHKNQKLNEIDSAVEDSTSSSDNAQVYHIAQNNEVLNQLLPVQVEPSSSSGIDIPVEPESPPKRRTFKKSFSASIKRVAKRNCHNVSAMNTSGASILYPGRMSQKDRRLLKMILVIFLSFVICHLPITVTKIYKGATDVHFFNIMGYLLIFLTTCVNPIIYVVMSSEYRQAYWSLLSCRKSVSRSSGKNLAVARSDRRGNGAA
ncbi:unnamed protein product [Hermetia illucens]|uniref:G-protein coupled receptors family 1 profile domain-containing protein n=1 Tax=Hermetia illucens TaxID=343691 RepID=A0A7R8UTB4_HERIL|nr:G-protein coupled receptor moody isoform X1 [Hermetia illucens]CAD7086622.1 unnamed protein product [Hermetia illucens]CAD7086623.1 unnamed protein product [Hermetia illucens]CAD7086624.1 unnamed protein product [Hermetia illucens]